MSAEHQVALWTQTNPLRVVVTIEPRRVDYPSTWFATDEHAEAHALRLQKVTGWRLVDRRNHAA